MLKILSIRDTPLPDYYTSVSNGHHSGPWDLCNGALLHMFPRTILHDVMLVVGDQPWGQDSHHANEQTSADQDSPLPRARHEPFAIMLLAMSYFAQDPPESSLLVW